MVIYAMEMFDLIDFYINETHVSVSLEEFS